MKVLIITVVKEYATVVRNILKNAGITAFTVHSAGGYKTDGPGGQTWFVSETVSTDSLMFTVFAEEGCVDGVFEKSVAFNAGVDSCSKIHLGSVALDRLEPK